MQLIQDLLVEQFNRYERVGSRRANGQKWESEKANLEVSAVRGSAWSGFRCAVVIMSLGYVLGKVVVAPILAVCIRKDSIIEKLGYVV